jgi:hypothetical protein
MPVHDNDYQEEINRGWGGIRTPGAVRHTRSPGVHNQPLCHPSESWFLLVLDLALVNRA